MFWQLHVNESTKHKKEFLAFVWSYTIPTMGTGNKHVSPRKKEVPTAVTFSISEGVTAVATLQN